MNTSRAINALVTAIILSIATVPLSAHADETHPDRWGNAPETRSPHPDAKGRSGHWWWPELPSRGPKATEQSGNRGRVFGSWKTSNVVVSPDQPAWLPGELIGCGSAMVFNNILFSSDREALSKDGKAEADKLIGEMGKFPNDTVTCVGHTDDTGSEAYNQQLGLRRAQAVIDYFAASGIEPQRLRAISKGETEPAVPNDTPGNRALNRRVVFQYKVEN